MSQALPRLPEEVRQSGVTTVKSSPDLTMVVHLVSPDNRYDIVYLRNYALLQVKDVLGRINGVGQVQVFGGGDYAMRIWLDPAKVASRGLTASDIVGRHPGAECAGGRRRSRRAADASAGGLPTQREYPRPSGR